MKRFTVVIGDRRARGEWIDEKVGEAKCPACFQYPEPVHFSAKNDLVTLSGIPDPKTINYLIETLSRTLPGVSFIFALNKPNSEGIERQVKHTGEEVEILLFKYNNEDNEKEIESTLDRWAAERENEKLMDLVKFIDNNEVDYLSGMAIMAIIDNEPDLAIKLLSLKKI